MQAQTNIYLVGMMGCGKTTVARALAEQLGRRFFDTDEEITRLAGRDISDIFNTDGEGVFRHQEGRVIRGLSAMHNLVSALGGGAMGREVNRARLSVSGTIIWLDFPVNVLLKRLEDAQDRPLLAGHDETEKHNILCRLWEARQHDYAHAHIHLKFNQETSVMAIVSQILKKL